MSQAGLEFAVCGGWPLTPNHPATASYVLGLQAFTAMSIFRGDCIVSAPLEATANMGRAAMG